jgi:transposase
LKRHILTDQRGTPLSAEVTGANTHDMKAAFETLDSNVVSRPPPRRYYPQHLCLDKGYDFQEIEIGVIQRGYIPHMRHRGEMENPAKGYKPKRWVVERSASWLNRFRRLLIRWEKKAENYVALSQLACCITVYRRTVLGWALTPSDSATRPSSSALEVLGLGERRGVRGPGGTGARQQEGKG